jgi:hypothetical protein
MHRIPPLALLLLAAAPPLAGQGIAVAVACHGECPAELPPVLTLDSIHIFADVAHGRSITYVHHAFSHGTAGSVDGEFFFPLPDDATVTSVQVYEPGKLETIDVGSGPEESRRMLDSLLREQPDSGLRAYAGRRLVHVRVPSAPPGGVQWVRLSYTQPLHREGGSIAYRYPLSAGGAAPGVRVEFRSTVKTPAGFGGLRSPSHAVQVEWGTELGPCPPDSRCGSMEVPSRRVKEVRLSGGAELRARDIEIVYTPLDAAEGTASVPER